MYFHARRCMRVFTHVCECFGTRIEYESKNEDGWINECECTFHVRRCLCVVFLTFVCAYEYTFSIFWLVDVCFHFLTVFYRCL